MNLDRRMRRLVKHFIPQKWLMARRLRMAGIVEPELVALTNLSRGGVFIDVGAHAGVWTAAMAKVSSRVLAFEPNPNLVKKARGILPANVELYEEALSDAEGECTLFVPMFDGLVEACRGSLEKKANGSAELRTISVHKMTLDSLGLLNVDTIKIDVEGHEAAVVRGAKQMLESQHPIIVAEVEERHHEGRSEAVIAEVCSLGYNCYYLRDGVLVRFKPGDISSLQRIRDFPPGKRPDDYVNNFIFLPLDFAMEDMPVLNVMKTTRPDRQSRS